MESGIAEKEEGRRMGEDILIRVTALDQYEVSFMTRWPSPTHFAATLHPCNFPPELKELMAAMDIIGTMNLLADIGRKTNDKVYMIYSEYGLDPFDVLPYPSIRADYMQFTDPLLPLTS